MSFDAQVITTFRILEDTVFGTGRTAVYRVNTMKATGATRHQEQSWKISADISNQEVTLSPFTASLPGGLLFFEADHAVDLRLNASNATKISGVLALVLAGTVSSIFITTSDTATIFRTQLVGGGSVVASVPLP
mgnify:CR=1 FL=1